MSFGGVCRDKLPHEFVATYFNEILLYETLTFEISNMRTETKDTCSLFYLINILCKNNNEYK